MQSGGSWEKRFRKKSVSLPPIFFKLKTIKITLYGNNC